MPDRERLRAGAWGAWYQTRAVDVSETGLGLLLYGPPVECGARITVELLVDDGKPSSGIHLHGTVRNYTTSPEENVSVGIEFSPITALEESLLRAQEAVAAH